MNEAIIQLDHIDITFHQKNGLLRPLKMSRFILIREIFMALLGIQVPGNQLLCV